MNIDLAIALRDFIATYDHLPVDKKALFIDSMNAEKCLTLQMMDGSILAKDMDGYRRISQPFVLLYKDRFSDSATKRASMLEVLNNIGKWFQQKTDSVKLPKFENLSWERIEQMNYAGLLTQDNASMTYTAQFSLIFSYIEN
jgi:hypothetical protein